MAFIPSEQFWLEQRVDQIDEQPGGDQRSERVVKNHGPISLTAVRTRRHRRLTQRRIQPQARPSRCPSWECSKKRNSGEWWRDASLTYIKRGENVPPNHHTMCA